MDRAREFCFGAYRIMFQKLVKSKLHLCTGNCTTLNVFRVLIKATRNIRVHSNANIECKCRPV